MATHVYHDEQVWEEAFERRGSAVFSVITFLHPLGFCLFPFGFSHVGRAWLLVSLTLACVARGNQFPWEIVRPVAATLGGFLVVVVALLSHFDEPAFVNDFIRLGAAGIYFPLCLLAFRGDVDLKPLGRGLACGAAVFLVASLPSMLTAFRDRSSSGSVTLYEQKDTLSASGFHINPNLPLLLCLVWFVLGYLKPRNTWIWIAALVCVGLSWLLGVRATFLGTALAWVTLVGLRLAPAMRRGWEAALGGLLLLPLAIGAFSARGRISNEWFFEADAFLSGRLTLWTAGWKSFLNHVWWGAGPESWKSQLAIHLPSTLEWREQTSLALETGGFHNGLIHVLAERGIVVGAIYLLTMFVAVRCAATILAAWRTGSAGAVAALPFAFLSLVFIARSLFEISGFFGYYKGPIDYLCTLLFAVTLSQASHLWKENT